jgi:mannose-6-phosphate isomerase
MSERRYPPLPFLLKVLSIRKPLSIQAHPNLELARVLHLRDPANYPDSNHKPEMGVALTAVRLLFGLRPHEELTAVLFAFSPLHDYLKKVVSSDVARSPDLGRVLLTGLYQAERNQVAAIAGSCRRNFAGAIAAPCASEVIAQAAEIFLSLTQDFPSDDVGLLVAPFLNLLTLKPSQGVFIPPHVPHAYLSGELVECMATSDNVVRAGLTEKFQDSATLLQMLSFTPEMPKAESSELSGGIEWYPRKCTEFQMGLIRAGPEGKRVVLLQHSHGPVVVLALRGSLTVTVGSESISLQEGLAAIDLEADGEAEVILEHPDGLAVVAR